MANDPNLPTLDERCDAGRRTDRGTVIDFNGKWDTPCPNFGRHRLAFGNKGEPAAPGAPLMRFCDRHIQDLMDAGMIDEVCVDPDEWARRVAEGRGN